MDLHRTHQGRQMPFRETKIDQSLSDLGWQSFPPQAAPKRKGDFALRSPLDNRMADVLPASRDPTTSRAATERYAAGETMAKLALEYECGEATIWRALQG